MKRALHGLTLLVALAACKKGEAPPEQAPEAAAIAIDGSSTVYPINEAVAEEFQKQSKVRVTIGVSGTGGGFQKLCGAEVALVGASRPINPVEVERCKTNGIQFIELPVAYDGIAIVVNPAAEWVDRMTVAELKQLWAPEAQGTIKKWSQIRQGWPDEEIHLFGPGVDSGTYDYFTQAIVGKEHSSRGDFTSSEDDNILVQGVSTDRLGLGYFGYAYYAENQKKLKLVPIDDEKPDNGTAPVSPTPETIGNGTYQPLSRPLLVYVNSAAADRPEVAAYVRYMLEKGAPLVGEVGYVALPERAYGLALERFKAKKTGSMFKSGGAQVGVSVEALLGGS